MSERAKIMVSLVTPLIDRLNRQMEQIGIRRDAYLTQLLNFELNKLVIELGDKCNSEAGKKYLGMELQKLPKTSVSIALNKSVIEKISYVCKKHNIDRDCLINRIIFFLSAERKHLINIGLDCSTHSLPVDLTEGLVNPFEQAHELINEPFSKIREWMTQSDNEISTFYLWPLDVIGLNCVIDDHLVPGTNKYLEFIASFS